MNLLYKQFRQESDGWTVELTARNLSIKFTKSGNVLTPEEVSFVRKLINRHKNRDEKKRNQYFHSESINRRRSEESSGYSTSKEFQSLFESLNDSSTGEEEENAIQEPEVPYKSLPDFLKDLKRNEQLNQHESDNATQYWKDIVTESSEDDILDIDSRCKGYKPVRNSFRISRKKKQRESKRDYFVTGKSRESNSGQRCSRGRNRLKELEKKRLTRNINNGRLATLGEVLVKNGLPPNTVICCSLCRLLIPNNILEEFFLAPCDCLEKFIHTECALLHQHKMVKLKCEDCQKFYTNRIVCKSMASSLSGLGGLEWDRLKKKTEYESISRRKDTPPKRLPAEYEKKCCICLDSRTTREDTFETLDSVIIKPCVCNVTCHNECLVKILLEKRSCEYCNYRFKFSTIAPRIGYLNTQVGLTSGFLQMAVISISFLLTSLAINLIHTSNHTINIILHNASVAIVFVITAYVIFSILRITKRKARERNRKTAIIIKSYQPSNAIIGRSSTRTENFEKQFEEISFEETENSYPGSFSETVT
uniref:RING-type domain-containing protein n=1 Tax=Caenorhabditis tropicalis TaxID=1561998 RepID=A0A1I7UBY1_9PELO